MPLSMSFCKTWVASWLRPGWQAGLMIGVCGGGGGQGGAFLESLLKLLIRNISFVLTLSCRIFRIWHL